MDFDHFDFLNAAPGEVLGLLVDVEPSAWVMSMLCSIDRSRLSDVEAVAFLQVHQRLTAWLAAIGLDAVLPAASAEPLVEEFTVLVPDSDEERTIRIADVRREELACALRLPASVAQQRIDTARLLAGPLAATGDALAVGDVTERHVAVIVEAAGRLPGRWLRDDAERASSPPPARNCSAASCPRRVGARWRRPAPSPDACSWRSTPRGRPRGAGRPGAPATCLSRTSWMGSRR